MGEHILAKYLMERACGEMDNLFVKEEWLLDKANQCGIEQIRMPRT